MVKRYGCAGILLFAIGLFPLMAQDNTVAKEMAIKIADRIVASTVYEFKDVKTGKVYISLDNVSLNPDIIFELALHKRSNKYGFDGVG
jgi:unsaturated rhamnogalacturonyl hydrolase